MATAPAYAQLVARRPYLWGTRRLNLGEAIVDFRCSGGEADLKILSGLMNWSAFKVVPTAPPVAKAAPVNDDQLAGLRQALAATEAARQALAQDLAALQQRVVPPPATIEALEPAVALAFDLRKLSIPDLVKIPGLTPKSAKALKAWADAAADADAANDPTA